MNKYKTVVMWNHNGNVVMTKIGHETQESANLAVDEIKRDMKDLGPRTTHELGFLRVWAENTPY